MIWVRCSGCQRVRFHSPNAGVWQEHPAPLPGEVAVICRGCLVEKQATAEREAEREARA